MTIDKKRPTPNLTLVAGSKADYEISLVRQIISGTLSGNEFADKVRPHGQLTNIKTERNSGDSSNKERDK